MLFHSFTQESAGSKCFRNVLSHCNHHPKPQHAALCDSDGTINICTQDRILSGACSKPPGFLDKMIISEVFQALELKGAEQVPYSANPALSQALLQQGGSFTLKN